MDGNDNNIMLSAVRILCSRKPDTRVIEAQAREAANRAAKVLRPVSDMAAIVSGVLERCNKGVGE